MCKSNIMLLQTLQKKFTIANTVTKSTLKYHSIERFDTLSFPCTCILGYSTAEFF